MTIARCLCGKVTWELGGPFQWMSHCHCSRCRKAHGAPFATYVIGPKAAFSLRGSDGVERWESPPGIHRCFCRRCGSVVPGDPVGDLAFAPAGNFEDDPEFRPSAHIFVASKAPWFEITDTLRRFDAYPPGFDAPIVDDRPPIDPPGKPRGSCLCGAVTFVVDGEFLRALACHCGRCQKARSAAFACNLVTRADAVRFTRGADLVALYKVPEAKHFTQAFCRVCGSSVPRVDKSRDLAVIPMGCLDDDPGVRVTAHIFVGSKASWDTITDSLPQYDEYPPP